MRKDCDVQVLDTVLGIKPRPFEIEARKLAVSKPGMKEVILKNYDDRIILTHSLGHISYLAISDGSLPKAITTALSTFLKKHAKCFARQYLTSH